MDIGLYFFVHPVGQGYMKDMKKIPRIIKSRIRQQHGVQKWYANGLYIKSNKLYCLYDLPPWQKIRIPQDFTFLIAGEPNVCKFISERKPWIQVQENGVHRNTELVCGDECPLTMDDMYKNTLVNLGYVNNSCYIDSVLFALLKAPRYRTSWVETDCINEQLKQALAKITNSREVNCSDLRVVMREIQSLTNYSGDQPRSAFDFLQDLLQFFPKTQNMLVVQKRRETLKQSILFATSSRVINHVFTLSGFEFRDNKPRILLDQCEYVIIHGNPTSVSETVHTKLFGMQTTFLSLHAIVAFKDNHFFCFYNQKLSDDFTSVWFKYDDLKVNHEEIGSFDKLLDHKLTQGWRFDLLFYHKPLFNIGLLTTNVDKLLTGAQAAREAREEQDTNLEEQEAQALHLEAQENNSDDASPQPFSGPFRNYNPNYFDTKTNWKPQKNAVYCGSYQKDPWTLINDQLVYDPGNDDRQGYRRNGTLEECATLGKKMAFGLGRG